MSEVITCPCGGASFEQIAKMEGDDEWFEILHCNTLILQRAESGTVDAICNACGTAYESGLDLTLCEFEEVAK
jgi:hypothetical protein